MPQFQILQFYFNVILLVKQEQLSTEDPLIPADSTLEVDFRVDLGKRLEEHIVKMHKVLK